MKYLVLPEKNNVYGYCVGCGNDCSNKCNHCGGNCSGNCNSRGGGGGGGCRANAIPIYAYGGGCSLGSFSYKKMV